MAHLLLLATLAVQLVSISSTDDQTTVADTAAATPGPLTLELEHVESTCTSISIRWNATGGDQSFLMFRIEAVNQETKIRLITPTINATEYTMPNLAVNAAYLMCVSTVADRQSEAFAEACATFETIPLVRDDSVIGLLVTLFVILALFIVALILWRCAIRRAESAEEPEVSNEEEKPQEEKVANEKSPLLVPAETEPAGNNPTDSNNQPQQPSSIYLFLAGPATA